MAQHLAVVSGSTSERFVPILRDVKVDHVKPDLEAY